MKIRFFIAFIICFLLSSQLACYANSIPPPTLSIYVKDNSGEAFYAGIGGDKVEYNPEPKKMYKYSDLGVEGYIYEDLNDIGRLEYEDIMGFKYCNLKVQYIQHDMFVLPNDFRIILQYESGKIVVSESIENLSYDKQIIYDPDSNQVVNVTIFDLEYYLINSRIIFGYLLSILITVIVELLVAILFRVKPKKIIVITNILSQIMFFIMINVLFKIQGIMVFGLFLLIALEAIIWTSEYFIYKFAKVSTGRGGLGSYVITANLLSVIFSIIMIAR